MKAITARDRLAISGYISDIEIRGGRMAKVGDLIKNGSLSAGQELIWSRRVAKETHLATVNQDGSITTADGIKHKTPSGAAKHLNGNRPVDGWLAWKVKSSLVSLAELRAKLT